MTRSSIRNAAGGARRGKTPRLGLLICGLLAAAGAAVAGNRPCDLELDDCLVRMSKNLGEKKGWVGIELEHEDDGTLTITRVAPESPAEAAGLAVGDRLLALDGVSYANGDRAALKAAYRAMVPGKTVTYTLDRGGQRLEVDVVLARLPDRVKAQWIAKHLIEAHSRPGEGSP